MARERWGSKLGVILAVAGSAVGLGNFLRFPGVAASNGGGAFMVPYLVSFFLLGLPLMWIEWTIGRFGGGFEHSTAPGIFDTVWRKSRFIKYFGVIGIFGPVVIFSYYTYIESWLLGYSFFALTGKYAACTNQQAMASFLKGYQGAAANEYFSGLGTAYLFFVITFILNVAVVGFGVNRGIERFCKWALPLLLVIACVLVVRVLTLGTPDPTRPENSILNGLGFLWNPDWSALAKGHVWLAAAGQIFFTLSVGFGVILTYASYLTKQDDVALSGMTAASANELAEVVLGGSIVIPAAFAFIGPDGIKDIASQNLFDLGFVTMPLILQKVMFGQFFGFLWFFLLFLAGVTSSISLALPAIAFLEDEFNLSRREASIVFGTVTFILCQPVIFFLGNGVLGEMDFWGNSVCLVVFATIEAILFAWVFGMDKAWEELHTGSDIKIPKLYRGIIKYITPLFLITILTVWLVQDWKKQFFMQDVASTNVPFVLMTRIGLLGLFVFLLLMVWIAWKRRPESQNRQEESL
ncbi:MAG TPA: sodium-dependent transporter [Anaerohalosphaeraceae bacterium]|nr:sodium-dependent transporter [Anaerohalosphaeraceae bacterium]HOL30444.1 sodium-dependent transporter [Anaerohalosphaeraceae bacterium]HPC64087.1 sodium-dependent transporter [Anaerohalosphaeraceae bacterium]HPO69617.1 sodium-dependent transporter [Anaerohalosphaeraceae bacterium]HRS71233.1 sodium-dependent transporter [Anaerohalosphaeraceae bacterium]